MGIVPLSKYRVSVLPCHFDWAMPSVISTERKRVEKSGGRWAIVGEIPGQAGNDGGSASAQAGNDEGSASAQAGNEVGEARYLKDYS